MVLYERVTSEQKLREGFPVAGIEAVRLQQRCMLGVGGGAGRGGSPGPHVTLLGPSSSLGSSFSRDRIKDVRWLCGIPTWQSLQML